MESQEVSFRVEKDDLAHAVGWVAKSLPTGTRAPAILRAIVITADDNGLEFAGFDYEVSTKVRISAEVLTEGRVAVAGKMIADITSVLPHKPVEVSVENNELMVTCGSSHFSLPLIDLEDYPKIPELPEVTGTIDPDVFSQAVTEVAVAASKDDTIPFLTGVHMVIDGDSIVLAATDRFRLAVRKLSWTPQNEDVTADLLIPAKTMVENAKTLTSMHPLEIAVGNEDIKADGLFGVKTDTRQTTTRMLGAEYPNIDPLLPKSHSCYALLDINPLQEALRRVSLVTGRNAQVRMEFSEGQVVLAASGTEAGHAEETLPCDYYGTETFVIAFNPSFLKDGLSVVKSERAFFGFTMPSRPAIIIPEPEELPQADSDGQYPTPDSDFTYLIMPVRLPG